MAFDFGFRWFGDRVKKFIDDTIDRKMYQAGDAIVQRAQQLAPVRTGALRQSITYVVAYNEAGGRHTLSIQVGVPYGIFQEFGTRNIRPHPYIRPALNEIGRVFGFNLQMQFANPGTHGLLAATGLGRQPGYAATAHPAYRPLTERQKKHVKEVLIPGVKRLHRGNVRRARFTVG